MRTQTRPKDLTELEANLGIKFRKPKLAQNAFIHRSYLNEHKSFRGDSNERLEFLGDSVLSLVVSNFLFEKLPKSAEGHLTQQRAALVRTETLAKQALELNLGKYLFLSKGEEESGGRQSKTILANTFEALIGAIFLDQGIDVAKVFIKESILDDWQNLAAQSVSDNKSRLQEVLQRKYHKSPTYKVLRSWGPDHSRTFEVGVFLDDERLGQGSGKNKQTAAQNAAAGALALLKA